MRERGVEMKERGASAAIDRKCYIINLLTLSVPDFSENIKYILILRTKK